MYFKGGGVCYLVSLNSYKLQIVLVLYTSDLLNHLPVRCFQILLNKRDTIFRKICLFIPKFVNNDCKKQSVKSLFFLKKI